MVSYFKSRDTEGQVDSAPSVKVDKGRVCFPATGRALIGSGCELHRLANLLISSLLLHLASSGRVAAWSQAVPAAAIRQRSCVRLKEGTAPGIIAGGLSACIHCQAYI